MAEMAGDIYLGLGSDGSRQALALSRSNRHGLIAGATGTGKTVTLQGLAESFSAVGVPVFVADVKGDLSGIAMPGSSDLQTRRQAGKPRQGIGHHRLCL